LEVRDITFQPDDGGTESVSIHLNRYFWPAIRHDFGGEEPLLEAVLTPTSIPQDLGTVAANGRWIRQIRTQYSRDTRSLKLYVDLQAKLQYRVSQRYDASSNCFVIQVAASGEAEALAARGAQRAAGTVRQEAGESREILALVKSWRRAWEDKDLGSYIAFYHEAFHSDGKDLIGWRQHKEKVFSGVERIIIKLSDLKISKSGSYASAYFIQRYRADAYQDVGYKQLEFKSEGDRWLIYRELWSADKPDYWLE